MTNNHLAAIEEIALECEKRANDFIPVQGLVFSNPPSVTDPSPAPKHPARSSEGVNDGAYALDTNQPANQPYLRHELWLVSALDILDGIDVNSGSPKNDIRSLRKETVQSVQAELVRLEALRASEWQRQEKALARVYRIAESNEVEVVDTSMCFSLDFHDGLNHLLKGIYLRSLPLITSPIVLVLRLLAALMVLICKISLSHTAFIIFCIQTLVKNVLAMVGADIAKTKPILSAIACDARIALDTLNLRPATREFVCCPKCWACYTKEDCPDTCTNKVSVDSRPCGRRLLETPKTKNSRQRGTRRYLHHDLKKWLGRLLCRPGMEKYMDRDVYDTGALEEGEMRDIWDGAVLRQFRAADGRLFVKPKNKSEGRYVFSLNMDGFNPLGNRQAGKSFSTGAIYMICLNLPPNLRYRPENIFLVGLMPGPEHPSLTQINHFLRILVDDLLVLWNRGIYYSRTPSHAKGRLVRCALIPVICDLPAARQIMGFAGHSAANFCNFCRLTLGKINDVDVLNWPGGIKNRAEYLRHATAWRDAPAAQQPRLFDQFGVRWTELLRLPYWDPTKYVVIDTMHLCFLGNYQRHCRKVWGMSASMPDGDGVIPSGIPDSDSLAEGWEIVRGGTDAELRRMKATVLRQICKEIPIPDGPNKAAMLESLKSYVCILTLSQN
jgi:hypothetical protein